MKCPFLTMLSVLLICSAILLGGCSDNDKPLGPGDGSEADLYTWIWALDDDSGTIWIHDADTGELKATLTGESHPMMRQAYAGPASEPTVWMGRGGTAHAFNQGFHMHGDHAHMEVPEKLSVVPTGPNNVHQGVDDHGDYVIYANDGDATFTLIDVATRTPRTINHGSPHSAAFYSHGMIVATHMQEEWARGIDAVADTILYEVAIAANSHGEAFHHDSETLFIATDSGFEVLDVEEGVLGDRIPYPTAGRVSFLYHAGAVPVAFGPHRTEGDSDRIILLDMANLTSEALTIPGSSLAWNIREGSFALSGNGRILVAADLADEKVYVVCIDPSNGTCYRSYTTVEIPFADAACAINHDGDHIWVLNRENGRIYCHHADDGELHNSWEVDPAADYIFATSLPRSVEVFKDF